MFEVKELASLKNIYIYKNELETLDWLPVKDRFNQPINSIVFRYFILNNVPVT